MDDRDTLAVCDDGCLQPWDATKMERLTEREREVERERESVVRIHRASQSTVTKSAVIEIAVSYGTVRSP